MLSFCFECGSEINESMMSCPKCVSGINKIIEKKPLRTCLHSDCSLQIQKGHYYCIAHAIKTNDDWCDICKEETGYHYPNSQQFGYGIAGTRNPRWAQRDYVIGSPKCRKCGKERGYVHPLFFWSAICGLIILSIGFLRIAFPILEDIIELSDFCGVLIIIFAVIAVILLLKSMEVEKDVTPMNKLEEKILEASKRNGRLIFVEDDSPTLKERILHRKNMNDVISHLKGEYLDDDIKYTIDKIDN